MVWLALFGGVVAAACAVACACACAWLARASRESVRPGSHAPRTTVYVPHPAPTYAPSMQPLQVAVPTPAYAPMVAHPAVAGPMTAMPQAHYAAPAPPMPQHALPGHLPVAPMSTDTIPSHVVFDRAATGPAVPTHGYQVVAAPRAPIVLEGRYPQLGSALGAWLQTEPDEVERIRIARDLGSVGGAGSARALLDGVRTGVLAPTIAADQLERGGFEAGVTVAAALHDPEPRVRALATSLVGRTQPLEPARFAAPTQRPMPDPPDAPPN